LLSASYDPDGNIWVAAWSGGQGRRFSPSGELTEPLAGSVFARSTRIRGVPVGAFAG
jgi:hypothetical protein